MKVTGAVRLTDFDPKPTFAAIRDAVLANSSGRLMLLHLCSWHPTNDSWEFGPYTGYRGEPTATSPARSAATRTPFMGTSMPIRRIPAGTDPITERSDYLLAHVPGVSDVEAQSQFSLWALMASPLIIGGDGSDANPATASRCRTNRG